MGENGHIYKQIKGHGRELKKDRVMGGGLQIVWPEKTSLRQCPVEPLLQ